LAETVSNLLQEIQKNMYQMAKEFKESNSHIANSLEELTQIVTNKRGFVLAGWCGDAECEKKVKEESGATSRNIPFDPPQQFKECVVCGKPAAHSVWFAKSY
jgi:prolyl-tRNA synthetase